MYNYIDGLYVGFQMIPLSGFKNGKVQRLMGFRPRIEGFYIYEGNGLDSTCRAPGGWNSSGRVEPMVGEKSAVTAANLAITSGENGGSGRAQSDSSNILISTRHMLERRTSRMGTLPASIWVCIVWKELAFDLGLEELGGEIQVICGIRCSGSKG